MRAFLMVDIQNDFMPFGALPVSDGDAVVGVANELAVRFSFVVATQDWHPAEHGSFAVNHDGAQAGEIVELSGFVQVLWPAHCVQNSPGASFHSGLDVGVIDKVVRKGTDPSIDSYSGFFDNGHLKSTGLAEMLRDDGVTEIVVAGLATDYCVRFTALDGLRCGFAVSVVIDGVRAVEMEPGDGQRALDEMRDAGCRLVTSADI